MAEAIAVTPHNKNVPSGPPQARRTSLVNSSGAPSTLQSPLLLTRNAADNCHSTNPATADISAQTDLRISGSSQGST